MPDISVVRIYIDYRQRRPTESEIRSARSDADPAIGSDGHIKPNACVNSCSYDYVELIAGDQDEGPKHCGDKSDVLKLTRFVTVEPKLRVHFVSDYSHSFSGFKARVSAEHGKCYPCATRSAPLVTRHNLHCIDIIESTCPSRCDKITGYKYIFFGGKGKYKTLNIISDLIVLLMIYVFLLYLHFENTHGFSQAE